MWFWLSLIALLCWSGSDLFSKIGCRDADDHLAHYGVCLLGTYQLECTELLELTLHNGLDVHAQLP